MASYHLSVQIIGRRQKRSAVKAAAYRAGEKLADRRSETVADYSRRRGIAHTEIMLPEGAAPWLADRETLWNHVEAIEKRADAQLAREINMALPAEMSADERRDLVRAFVAEQFVSRGMVADIALHDPVPERGDDPLNFHCHIMLTLRQAEAGGLRRVKTREWNTDAFLEAVRAAWAVHQNRALERCGHPARVDHRSLEVQRAEARARGDRRQAAQLDRIPELHVGPRAAQAARRGYRPTSQDRPAGPDRPSGRRTVRYPEIDRGQTRFEANVGRVEANLARTEKAVSRWHARAAQFRLWSHRLSRQEYEAQRAVEREEWQAQQRKMWQRKRDQEEVWRAMMGIGARKERAARRRKVIDGFVLDIDRVVSALFGLKENQLRRRQQLARKLERPRSPERGQERAIERTRMRRPGHQPPFLPG